MKQKKATYFFILSILVPALAFAGGKEGIPFGFLFSQIFNFLLFALILIFLLRKKGPAFLRQKQVDFLEYRKKAQALKQQYQADCLTLQEKIQQLKVKHSQIKADVAKALNHDKEEMARQVENQINILKTREEQALKRQRLKEVYRLRSRLLSQVMAKTSQQINQEPEKLKLYDHLIIQKMEQKI